MTDTAPIPDALSQTCSRCGVAFRCGMQSGELQCWCAALPPLPLEALRESAGCLCPRCLETETARHAPR